MLNVAGCFVSTNHTISRPLIPAGPAALWPLIASVFSPPWSSVVTSSVCAL